MEKQIIDILKDIQPTYNFEENVDFIKEGYLDSFDIVVLIAELEEAFFVSISALDIVPENFTSVKNMCGLINRSAKREH